MQEEISRRTSVSGVFPNEVGCFRLILTLLMVISDEWQIDNHYCASESLDRRSTEDNSDSYLENKGYEIL